MTQQTAETIGVALMGESPRIPPGALSGMDGWAATVAWTLVPERVTWRLRAPDGEIRYLKVYQLGQELSLAAERDRLAWAIDQLPVPRVLDCGSDGTHEWLLTAGLEGVNAIHHEVRANLPQLIRLLADGLRNFHALSVGTCPFDSRVDYTLHTVQQRVAAGLVDATRDLDPDHGGLTGEEALTRLLQLRPQQEDLVVCHGDYCVPNILISNARVSGYVDLGVLGVADRWRDLAVATWSVSWNFGPGWEDLFLATYGVERDPQKIAFYRLLYDLLP